MELDFGGVIENVVTRKEYPLAQARRTLANEIVAVLGYGPQGQGQALNTRDNGINVIVGQRSGSESYDKVLRDGWEHGKTLFSLEEAAERGTIVQYLLSDAGQREKWPDIKPHLKAGDALYFSHGFSIVYNGLTGVVPPENIDVILVAPKGTGRSVRENFLAGSGINSSYAVEQDYTGRAKDRALALGIAIGSGYLFPTTFKNEVFSDLTGERAVLLGALWGIMEAQYHLLRRRGHSPSEAYNETVEELTQSLIPLAARGGMDYLFDSCSTTAQIGALDWGPIFEAAVSPLMEEIYKRVADGREAKRVLETNSKPDYRASLQSKLKKIRESEMWRAGATVRSLRPEN